MKYLRITERPKFKSATKNSFSKNSSPKTFKKYLSIKTVHTSKKIIIFGSVTIEKDADYSSILTGTVSQSHKYQNFSRQSLHKIGLNSLFLYSFHLHLNFLIVLMSLHMNSKWNITQCTTEPFFRSHGSLL